MELDNIQIPALFVFLQMTFEMSHETLYLAVKLVDHYLMKVICKKDKLQLLGSTAFMIAAKFEVSPNPWDLEKINFCPSHVCMYVHVCAHVYNMHVYIYYIHIYHMYACVYICIYVYLCVYTITFMNTIKFSYQIFVCLPWQGSWYWVQMVVYLFPGINKVLLFPL